MKANLYPIFLCAIKVTDFVGFCAGKRFFSIELSFNGVKLFKVSRICFYSNSFKQLTSLILK